MNLAETTTETLTIGRRTFTVERIEGGYRLHGVKGASYRTMRNAIHPEFMFLINHTGVLPFPGVWLTDKNGKLERA